ncbi:hypothetical protein LPB86_18215 [Pedobacter sp. MC2016-14]|uniref:hypothetical protein n=1 Tax=Pedobacter sp. MC2016-14 TaxID=2897327 RepID=UPI001E344478|nr:hypothetical protein [Pedobacter sp. MC2016-14]MCD0490182.1 hypothetical protein [Pedobacter sp. MC2016-14]
MKAAFLILAGLFAVTAAPAQQIYNHPDLKDIIKSQKRIAILPFNTRISYKTQPRSFDPWANRTKELDVASTVQSSLYTFLLDRGTKNRVSFQDVDETNLLLKKAGMADSLFNFSNADIIKTLGVDAIIGGKYEIEHIRTDTDYSRPKRNDSTSTATNTPFISGSAILTITINDASNNGLLWRYYNSATDYSVWSTKDLLDQIVKKASRNLPYTK